MNKTPVRQCISCRKQLSRNSFIRLMKTHNNSVGSDEVIINPTKYSFGRSAYICLSQDCIKAAIKQKKSEKMLRVSAKVLEKIIPELEIWASNACLEVPA